MKLALSRRARVALYALFALAAFVFALRQTLPVEAVRERLVMEAAQRGLRLTVAEVRPAGLVGLRLDGVALETRDGLRVPVERLDATLRLLPLLLGRRGLAFDAWLFAGRVTGVLEARGSTRRIQARASGLDLARAAPLKRVTGADLAGVVRADVDLALDEKAPAQSSGHLDLTVEKAALAGGELPVPGMSAGLTLPRVELGRVEARALAKEGKLLFEQLQSRGGDVEATGEGLYLLLGPKLEIAPSSGSSG